MARDNRSAFIANIGMAARNEANPLMPTAAELRRAAHRQNVQSVPQVKASFVWAAVLVASFISAGVMLAARF